MNTPNVRHTATRAALASLVSIQTVLIGTTAAAGISAGLVLTGCADTIRAPGSATPDPLPNVAYPKIEAAEGLGEYLSYGDVKITSQKPLTVQVPIRPRTESEDLRVQYRFIFLDQFGVALNPDAAWTWRKLASRRQDFLSGNAMTSKATDWRLEIRPSR